MSNLITIGISDMNVVKKPDRIITYALGSCIGICLYDAFAGVAGMAHIMLPSFADCVTQDNPYKFADTAVPILLKRMEEQGAAKMRIVAKIAGGAQMFKVDTTYGGASESIMSIGKRNITAVKKALEDSSIKLIAEDVGANYGRTVEFSAETGIMTVRTLAKHNSQL